MAGDRKPPGPPDLTVVTGGAAGGQPGYPNLRGGAEGWKPGQSGNPAGVSKYQAELQAAIEARYTPERVLGVLDAMEEDAKAHEKYSPAAAKVFLGAVGVNLNREPAKVDWTGLPDEVVAAVAERIR